jgi:NAD(P)-dependent dehydrogenase (short-subunit alcohol dehydrogenase family)
METILVTGTSSGIGRATALRLAANGHRVLAGVRDPADGASLQAELNGSNGQIEPVILDVTEPATIEGAVARAKELTDRDGLTGVVNNAGQPVTGPMEVLPIDDLRHELEVNLIGQIAVTQAFLPMLRATEGRIVFVSSIGGQVVFPFAGAYHASKFGLEAAAEALRTELRGTGVDVAIVEPGITDSKIWAKALEQAKSMVAGLPAPQRNLYEAEMKNFEERLRTTRDGDNMSAAKVAGKIEKALTSRRPPSRFPIGIGAKIAYRIRPWIPDRVWGAVTRQPFSG